MLERHHENRRVLTISLGKYRGTGLTEAALRGGEFVDAVGYNARVTYALGRSPAAPRPPCTCTGARSTRRATATVWVATNGCNSWKN